MPFVDDESLFGENIDFEYHSLASSSSIDADPISKVDVGTQTEYKSPEKEKRDYFIEQATCSENCYHYTGVTRSKLDLLFEFLQPKATDIRVWRGSKKTKSNQKTRS